MKFTVDIPDKIANEFIEVAKVAGFKNGQSLLQNYIREVILASRADKAALIAKQNAVSKSIDLDDLIPPEKLSK